jgi:hypothetical protein
MRDGGWTTCRHTCEAEYGPRRMSEEAHARHGRETNLDEAG